MHLITPNGISTRRKLIPDNNTNMFDKFSLSQIFFFLSDGIISMPFTVEDKVIIKHYRLDKKYGSTKLANGFPDWRLDPGWN